MFRSIKGFVSFINTPHKKLSLKLRHILGYFPQNMELYRLAFTHRSAAIKGENGVLLNNERLEFLGDAILDAIVADYLFRKFPDKNEGFLTQLRSRIVNTQNLTTLARKLTLDQLIINQTTVRSTQQKFYGDAFEALVGAIYLDRGYKNTSKIIVRKIIKRYINLNDLILNDTNFKSQLIEWGQKFKRQVDFYTELESPDSKIFISIVTIGDSTYGTGTGSSKKEAEQNAAKETITMIDNFED